MVFMARAAAPIFPGWLGCDNTIRTWDNALDGEKDGIGKNGGKGSWRHWEKQLTTMGATDTTNSAQAQGWSIKIHLRSKGYDKGC
ncbi:MAG: hypothetical protein LBU46_04765 [Candidatus Accumulibacter sp.]|jgi:hypothetical protein|nr:hypothetical protein [Accumulibacter sp.]